MTNRSVIRLLSVASVNFLCCSLSTHNAGIFLYFDLLTPTYTNYFLYQLPFVACEHVPRSQYTEWNSQNTLTILLNNQFVLHINSIDFVILVCSLRFFLDVCIYFRSTFHVVASSLTGKSSSV